MCRNIRTLHNFDPPATQAEIEAAALQFVRKVSGSRKPSKMNTAVFEAAIKEIAESTSKLLESLETQSPPKNREEEKQKAIARNLKRFS